jgi:hypothetical protein
MRLSILKPKVILIRAGFCIIPLIGGLARYLALICVPGPPCLLSDRTAIRRGCAVSCSLALDNFGACCWLLRGCFGAYCDAVMDRAGIMAGMTGWANRDGWGDWMGLNKMVGATHNTGAFG